MVNSDIKRRIDRLDSLFLWVCSFSALGFSIFVGYLQVPVLPYVPIFILIACSVVIGYIFGAVFSDSFTQRIRGWNYLLIGLAIYIPFAVTQFGKNQIDDILPTIQSASMYFQIVLGSIAPAFYFLTSKKLLSKIYKSFRILKGDVTNATLQSSFLASAYFAIILYLSAVVLQQAETALNIRFVYVLLIAMFVIQLILEESKIRHLMRLEENQHLIKHETITAHRRLPNIAFGLLISGIVSWIVLLQIFPLLPFSPWTLYCSVILFLLSILGPIVGLLILIVVKPSKHRFTVKSEAMTQLSPENLEMLRNLAQKLNKY